MINYTSEKQLTIPEFESPFTKMMNPENRWVKLAGHIPWDELVSQYMKVMRDDFGRPGINPRIVIGSIIIKHLCGFSDEQTIEHISENVYMQYFLGYQGFNDQPPFDASLFVLIRKRLGLEVFEKMNECILGMAGLMEKKEETDEAETSGPQDGEEGQPAHKGRVLFDATVCPQDIKYPNDLELISDARSKSEELIDVLYKKARHGKKPRTDRNRARRDYVSVAKKKTKSRKTLRKAIRRQLSYLRRNIKSIDRLLDKYEHIPLKEKLYKYMLVIREVYQQQQMYKERTNRIADRIVSIHQPHVRPMVRGKASAKVEFGSKVSLSLVEGYAMIERLNWDAFNEGTEMMAYISQYKERFGYYPKEVAVDKLFTSRENRKKLKKLGIKLIGKPLGRPPKGESFDDNPGARNPIEGKFGQGKRAYRLDRVYAKLKDTSESWISASFFVMNLLKLVKQCQLFWLQTIFNSFIRRLQGLASNISLKSISPWPEFSKWEFERV